MEPLTEVCVYCMASREASPMKRCPSCDELPPSEVTEGDFRMMTEDEQNEYLKESNEGANWSEKTFFTQSEVDYLLGPFRYVSRTIDEEVKA